MLQLTEENHPDIHYILLEGRLDGRQSDEANRQLENILNENTAAKFVLDLAKLEYMSSAGLRVLLMAAKRAKAGGKELVICSPTPEVKEILDISGFGSIMSIVDCRDTV